MTGRPVWKQSLMAAWMGRYVASGYASETGAPMTTRGAVRATSSLHHSMTCPGPLNSTIAAAIAPPPQRRARPVPADGLPIVQQSTRDCLA
jgi:hypothetical protein